MKTPTDEERAAYRALNDQLTGIIGAMPKPEGCEDWVYRDLDAWLDEEYWTKFMGILGEGNYKMLAGSRKTDENGVRWYRAQFLFSPTAMENLREYNKNKP